MTFAFGAKSEAEMKGVHPGLVDVVRRALAQSPVDFAVHDGIRTTAEQKNYVAAGVSQTMSSLHLPQADGLGHAVDLVPYVNGKLRWEWPPIYAIAAAMRRALDAHNAEQAKAGKPPLRIRWGGAWRDLSTIDPSAWAMDMAVRSYTDARRKAGKPAFQDGPHFEVMP